MSFLDYYISLQRSDTATIRCPLIKLNYHHCKIVDQHTCLISALSSIFYFIYQQILTEFYFPGTQIPHSVAGPNPETMAYCDRCERDFISDTALDMHKKYSSRHNLCCNKDFLTYSRLQQHWTQSPEHDYCPRCDELFDDEDELDEHLEENHSYCKDCNRIFTNDYGLKQHYSQSDNHHYCEICDRHFQQENDLRNHLNSSRRH